MLNEAQRRFLSSIRVAHLATADAKGAPHVVPVCFIVDRVTAYVTIDAKPKQIGGPPLKRLRNILENPSVALVADHYDDSDWSRLGWVMLRGQAEILDQGGEHDSAQEMLRRRYPQLRTMAIEQLPVIAIRIDRVTSWGDLASSVQQSP